MNATVKRDLDDMSDICETLKKRLTSPKGLTLAEWVDVAARIKPVEKALEELKEAVKGMVLAKRKGNAGEVLGDDFKAVVSLVPTTRLDQKALKEGDPAVHAKYNKSVTDTRVTYEVR